MLAGNRINLLALATSLVGAPLAAALVHYIKTFVMKPSRGRRMPGPRPWLILGNLPALRTMPDELPVLFFNWFKTYVRVPACAFCSA